VRRKQNAVISFCFAISLLVCACSLTRLSLESRGVDDVVRSSTTLEGTKVRVRGYLRFGDDSRNLWADRNAYDAVSSAYVSPSDPAWNRCVTLYDIGAWRKDLLARNSTDVVIGGVIRRRAMQEGDVSLSSCSDLGISVLSVESAP